MKKYLIKLLMISTIGGLVGCASGIKYTNPSEFLPSYVTVANNQDYVFYENDPFFRNLTPLQLNVMQTRKFNKPFMEVVNGISTMCKDSGGSFTTSDALDCNFPVNRIFMFSGSDSKNNHFHVKYFLEAKEQATIVRIRMYGSNSFIGKDTPQFAIDSLYQAQFKKVADALFVQAIPFNPQEMN